MAPDLIPLESTRLVMRRFRASDLDAFHAYRSDPELARYQGWSEPSIDEARQFVEKQSTQVPGALGSGAQIAIEHKATGAMIGDLYLHTPAEQPHLAEIGFTLAREHQDQGFATEAVEALLDGVFGALDKHRVTALTFAANTRSVALLERIGMRREAHHIESSRLDGGWTDDYVYGLLQQEWHRRRRP